ncbi:MAG: hypothetical protein QXT01_02675 [Sulfolobales archaeon]
MKSLLRNYIEGLQVLRVKAGLTIVSRGELLKSLIKEFLTYSTFLGLLLTSLLIIYDLNAVHTIYILIPSIPALALLPHLRYRFLARTYGKALENELTYFIISEAITLTNSTELINDICELGDWGKVFPNLSRCGLRLNVYKKFLTLFESVNHYIKYVSSEFISRLLSDYILAVSRGMINSWITHTSTELLRKLGSNAKTLIKLRTTTVLIIGILLSYLPTLIFSISVITGEESLTSAAILMPILTVFTILFLPRNVQHLRIYLKFGMARKLLTYMSYLMILLTAYYMFSHPITAKYLILTTAAVVLINGLLGLHKFYEVMREVYEIPRIIYMFAETPHILINPLKALKDVLSSCKSKSLRELSIRLDLNKASSSVEILNSWLGRYIYYVLVKSLINGSLSKEQLLSLRILTLDMLDDIKQYLVSALPLLMMSLMMPWFMISMTALAGVETTKYGFYIYLLTMTYSIYVDYVVFTTPKITLVSAMTLLLLGLIWVG